MNNPAHHVRTANKGCRRLRRLLTKSRADNVKLCKWQSDNDIDHALKLIAEIRPARLTYLTSKLLRTAREREVSLLRACDARDRVIISLGRDPLTELMTSRLAQVQPEETTNGSKH